LALRRDRFSLSVFRATWSVIRASRRTATWSTVVMRLPEAERHADATAAAASRSAVPVA